MGVTFFWIGILILRNPGAWAAFIQPWAAQLLIIPAEQMMIGVGIADIIIGFLFLIDKWTWWVSLVASLHFIVILVTSGITDVTARDIGLMGGSIAILLSTRQPSFIKFKKLSKDSHIQH